MYRRLTPISMVLAVAVGVRVAAADPPPAGDAARSLDSLEQALDRAVARVSRASVQVAQRGSSTRGYLLAGYGVLFVVPPRALPVAARSAADTEAARALQQATRGLEAVLQRADDPGLRLRIQASLAALRAAQGDPSSGSVARERAREAQMQAVERQMQSQMEALQREAERSQAETERAMEQMGRELRSRLRPRPAVEAVPPLEPAASAPPESVEAPEAPAPPAPPWSFWFEFEEESASPSPDRLVRDVGAAVAEVFEARGASLRPVKGEEYLAAAVDFFPRGAFAPRTRPQRTLLVRVKKQDLLARQAGRLTPEELRRRVEFLEY